jgi:hypothetical protein
LHQSLHYVAQTTHYSRVYMFDNPNHLIHVGWAKPIQISNGGVHTYSIWIEGRLKVDSDADWMAGVNGVVRYVKQIKVFL